MNSNKSNQGQEKLNIDALLQLLNHNQINYAFFAVSRIKVISKIIGPKRTTEQLVPQLKRFATKNQLFQEISDLIRQAILQMQDKESNKKQ